MAGLAMVQRRSQYAPRGGAAETLAPAQGVLRMARRDRDAVVRIDDVAVGVAAAVCDPYAAAHPHDRLERRDHAAHGALADDLFAFQPMNVRFAVGDDDEQLVPEDALDDL